MAFDWTAAAIGILLTLVGSLSTAVALLVRRELDHQRERLGELDARLRDVERAQDLLDPLAKRFRRNMEEEAGRILP